jgi:hypothetical protein
MGQGYGLVAGVVMLSLQTMLPGPGEKNNSVITVKYYIRQNQDNLMSQTVHNFF